MCPPDLHNVLEQAVFGQHAWHEVPNMQATFPEFLSAAWQKRPHDDR